MKQQNVRIKAIRKELNLSQAEFGRRIGVSRNVINNLEGRRVELPEVTLKAICAVFSVNEDWLRNGDGDMFLTEDNSIVDQLIKTHKLDSLDKKILLAYLQLNDFQRKAIKDFVYSLVDSIMPAGDYEEYREEYIQDRATLGAARHGDSNSMEELADKFDSIDGEDK